MTKKLTTEEFIDKAIKVHGDRFSYGASEYISSREKIKITCKIHGIFEQTASSHLKGNGCNKCRDAKRNPSKEKISTTTKQVNPRDEFIRKAKIRHGEDKYDYSLVEYVNSSTNVTIVCREHGPFSQRPSHHTAGRGCPKCFAMRYGQHLKLTQAEFIKRSVAAHVNKYDYSLVNYKQSKTAVDIICPVHGVFKQQPRHHMNGQGCSRCGDVRCSEAHSLTTEDFIKRAEGVHGDKYCYDLVDYKSARQKIKIVCKEHGEFLQAPFNHLAGRGGCSHCAGYGFNRQIDGFVYILQSDDMFKVGITNRDVSKRVKDINKKSPQKFDSVYYKRMCGLNAEKVEGHLLKWLIECGLRQPKERFDGCTECFYVGSVTIPQIIDKLLELEMENANG